MTDTPEDETRAGEGAATATRATPEGTRLFAERSVARGHAVAEHFRAYGGLAASSIGVGTYLGEPDDPTDVLYTEAILEALDLGCNVVDSAINYRFQRGERSVGAALERAFAAGRVARPEVIVSTKGGFVPYDGERPRTASDVRRYVERTYLVEGVCRASDFALDGQHCMAPGFLAHELRQSLTNLRLDCVDVYYVHNPESQLGQVDRAEFDRRLRAAFERLESEADAGRVARYGLATWHGFRVAPSEANYLSLERVVRVARDVAGDGHRFGVVQLPHNLAMSECYADSNQSVDGEWVTFLGAATRLGVDVVASGSLLQSRLTSEVPEEVRAAFPHETDAQSALEFVRSTPGIATALVGMSRTAHVRENLALARSAPAGSAAVAGLFEADE